MARNRVTKQFTVDAAVNVWVQIPVEISGKLGVIRTSTIASVKAPQDPIEVALSVASPSAAGFALATGEATQYNIQNAATHTLWVRRTTANVAGGVKLDIDPMLSGNVLSATA